MLTQFASHFIKIGHEIAEAETVLFMAAEAAPGSPERELDKEEKKHLADCIQRIVDICPHLDLPVSHKLFSEAIEKLPATPREFEIMVSALNAEMKSKLFVFVPTHRRKFMQPRHFMAETSRETFPNARQEMSNAGKCHAVGMHTAAVFHCVRAVEIGLRVVARELDVQPNAAIPLEMEDQETVIRGIESKIAAMKDRKKGVEKDADLNFYSEIAMQFRYFKDGWRVRAAHTRATYDEGQANSVLEHASTFIDGLSKRMKEPVV